MKEKLHSYKRSVYMSTTEFSIKLTKEDLKTFVQQVFEDGLLDEIEDFDFEAEGIKEKIERIMVTYIVIDFLLRSYLKDVQKEMGENVTYDTLDLYKAIYELTNDDDDEDKKNLVCQMLYVATKGAVENLEKEIQGLRK